MRTWLAASLLLLASVAGAQEFTHDDQLHVFPGGLRGDLQAQGGGVYDVRAYGAKGDGTTDDTAAIQAALNAAGAVTVGTGTYGSTVYVPPGKYLVSSSLTMPENPSSDQYLRRGMRLMGAGKGSSILLAQSSGTGFAVLRSANPMTCTGGSGDATSCDDRYLGGTRGPGCVCSTDADCDSGACDSASTPLMRNYEVSNLGILIRTDNVVGIDATRWSNSTLRNLAIGTTTSLSTYENVVGVVFADGDAAGSGYTNTLENSVFGRMSVCVLILGSANDQKLTSNQFGNECGSGLVLEGSVNATQVFHNLFQSTGTSSGASATCTASACVGGYFHGKTCSVAADCGEADIVDMGYHTQIIGNRFEDSRNSHIRLGENSSGCAGCATTISQEPIIIGNYHSGTGTAVSETAGKAQDPLILGNNFVAGTFVNKPGRIGWNTILYEPTDAPGTSSCGATYEGATYYDDSLNELCLCNGTAWVQADGGGTGNANACNTTTTTSTSTTTSSTSTT